MSAARRCFTLTLVCISLSVIRTQESCPAAPRDTCGLQSGSLRFLLYSVRRGEGFNLCRDVYMRMAEVAVFLRQKGLNVTLILPEWGPLPHWPDDAANQNLSWSQFFHVPSLNLLTPVMEMSDFVSSISDGADLQLRLSHFPDTFSPDYKWSERYEISDCDGRQANNKDEGDDSAGDCAQSSQSKCLLLDGTTLTLANSIERNFRTYQSILISNADVVLHENYGSAFFWQIRRSMRFSDNLIQKGDRFRSAFLQSDDFRDGTRMESDWRLMRRQAGHATGGEFVALHWRRGDFVHYRPDVPDIQCTAEQVIRIFSNVAKGIRRLFLATDAAKHEIDQLLQHLREAVIDVHMFDDGGGGDHMPQGLRAIIDQWICAHSRFFIGSYGSTFSFRIQEEREILGFPPETTFNALCAKCEKEEGRICKQELRWRIKYPASDANISLIS